MLKSLSISNYALIDSVDIQFEPGFSVITGETGAGKSILLGALSLILGQRFDTKHFMDKSKKCIVEGLFEVNEKTRGFFDANELDYELLTTLRREITPSGNSRAFINDTPVNLVQMKEFASLMIDIHSQHETLELKTFAFQLNVVNSSLPDKKLHEQYRGEYRNYSRLQKELNSLSGKSHNLKRDEEYFRFQFEQLEQAKFEENEQEELESKLNVLVHAEEITETLYKANSYIADDEKCALNILRELKSDLDKLASYYSKAGEISGRMDHILIELKDIAGELESASSHIDYDPQQVEKIRERLSLLYELQQKHRVGSVRELIEIKDDFALKLNSVESCDAELRIIQKDIENSRSILLELAEKLHNEREKQIPVIERFVIDNLRQLGMPEAKFRIALTHEPELNENGRNSLKFLFSANRKAEPAEISRVASGGELSRLMLCFKMYISQSISLPTLILDEIDIGISGEIAGKMGTIMKNIAENNQVIAITHLPQIAAKGNIQYTVYKETDDDGARTRIKLLDNDGRVAELAKMLSGDVVSDAAVENARILLKN